MQHAESPPPWPAERVIDTRLLGQRPSKPPDHRAESAAMLELAQALANDPDSVVQRLVEAAMRLTGAGSAGLSLVESVAGAEHFRWIATAGEYERYLHGTMPRDFSPCGEVLRRAEPLLMRDMVRAYPYVEQLHAPPAEVLLVPFAQAGTLVGTVWVAGHTPDHAFDAEDLRIVKSLAVFASAVLGTVGLVRDLARELKDTRRLRDVAARMIGAEGDQALFEEILDAAIEITAADGGTIQLLDQPAGCLTFLATRGFGADMVSHFARVDASPGTPCGIALATGRRATVDFGEQMPDPDGANRRHRDIGLASAQSTPLISRSGQPLGMFSTHWRTQRELPERELRFLDLLGRQAADLIERIRSQDALRDGERELRDGARRKDEFLAVLAHELRNPLAPIRTGVEVLKNASHEPLVAKVRPMMERQVNHMVRLIDDLLDVSRITSGKVELRRQAVGLGSLVDTAAETHRSAMAAAGLQFELDVDAPERQISVDPTRMSQVLSNILHNATKFTGSGGKVTLRTELADDEQVFRITDTGLGIARDSLPTIFDLFTQVRPDSSQRHGGMGLGLALARSLVELHGGSITANSGGTGLGSTFVVRVPLGQAPAEYAAAAAPAASLAGQRVLVVDDNQDAADALGELLAQHGCEVRVSYLAEPALALLHSFDPSLVLLDIGMPTIDGYEACRRMRAAKPAGLRIVALTGWGQAEDRQRAADAGFDAHLTKPVDFARLAALARTPG